MHTARDYDDDGIGAGKIAQLHHRFCKVTGDFV